MSVPKVYCSTSVSIQGLIFETRHFDGHVQASHFLFALLILMKLAPLVTVSASTCLASCVFLMATGMAHMSEI